MKLLLQLFLLLFSVHTSAQITLPTEKIKTKIEKYILENKTDSVHYYLKQIENDKDTEIYSNLINNQEISYSDFYSFVSKIGNRRLISFEKVSDFINSRVKQPINQKKINLEYVKIKWTQVSKLRDEVSLDKASLEQKKLENYINKFKDSDKDVTRAKIKINTHPIVMYLIEKDVKKGKELCLKSLDTARALNDKELEITFLYHLSDFLVLERKLDEYIKVSEESLEIEKQLPKKSVYYHATLEHLVDAYIYKGGNNKRAIALIDILNTDEDTRIYTYGLYLKLINRLEKTSSFKKDILQRFEVKNIAELITKFEILSQNLSSNDLFRFYGDCSNVLENYGFYKKAIEYKDKSVKLNQKIYSEELSNSLANFKTSQVVKETEKQLVFEKEKTRLYFIIAVLSFVIMIITILVLRKLRKQSHQLTEKNNLVKKSLEEKELLITEMHHRVKNNFQLITSLLELQTQEIEDQNVIDLLEKGKSRIKSMSLIHQKLYGNESGLIKFDEFINLLVKELAVLYKYDENLKLDINVKEVYFDVDTAIPLALILNELITNSFKYAIKNNNNLYISLSKISQENYELIVKDNGLGLKEEFNIQDTETSGLKLVERLVRQLQGGLKITNESGAKFQILFKDTKTRKEII
jgi:two-component system, sensor histidine kinase PdtaS